MSYTLDRFAAESHRILAADSGLEGREQVRAPHGCALLPFNAFPGLTLGEHANGPRAHSVAIQGFEFVNLVNTGGHRDEAGHRKND
jgi:hypothetical protein